MMDWLVFGLSVAVLLVSVYVLGFIRGVSQKGPQEPRKRKLPFMAGRFGP